MRHHRFLLLLFAFATALACSDDGDQDSTPSSPVSMTALRVDHLSSTVEGGFHYRNLHIASALDSLPILTHYEVPGDFGSVALEWMPTGDSLFYGDVIWMGLGERHLPVSLLPNGQFRRINAIQPFPDSNELQWLFPQDTAGWRMRLTQAWTAIDDFELVHERHPDLPIGVFFYAPSVGVGDPATWKYWFFIPRKTISVSP